MLNKHKGENPQCIILTGDFTCRSSQWWTKDIEQPEGTALEELIETNGLYQLIVEPTNVRNGSMSYIDLIITDQPNMFVDYGNHPLWMIIASITGSIESLAHLYHLPILTKELLGLPKS